MAGEVDNPLVLECMAAKLTSWGRLLMPQRHCSGAPALSKLHCLQV